MTIVKKIVSQLSNLPKNDHRLIGNKQNLFFFDELSQGSCFFLPRGAHIYNKLIEYLRGEYRRRNYREVITPNIYDCRLWETSGHWQHYHENMIKFKMGERDFSLKPMNCPGHCIMFKHLGKITNEDLPLRLADFGVLHRNELSGSILGLSRVRRFQQDDAHIFCTPEQVESEVKDCLDFASKVYGDFGFSFEIALSLRPQDFMGEVELWDRAEDSLRTALDSSKLKWHEQKFEGAFYGPKIDLIVKDSNSRSQQCATIQLDFQLPQRFDLGYKDLRDKSVRRPVMIHRAILGSIERFIAMVAENCEGRWPFWLSPIQVQIVPTRDQLRDYALKIEKQLRNEDVTVDVNLVPGSSFGRKIREAELTRYNLIVIVGDKEAETNSVTVRMTQDNKTHNVFMSFDKLLNLLKELKCQSSGTSLLIS